MNPIKNPKEILLELAGIPHLAGGGQFGSAIKNAVEKYKRLFGRSPSAEEMMALEKHVASLSQPSSVVLRQGPDAQARAAYELATDPNLINPNTARDEFLMKMLTNRTQKGSRMSPKVYDVTAPEIAQKIEEEQMGGKLAGLMKQSPFGTTTPSADYLAKQSQGLVNEALTAGKVPLIDKIKMAFYKENGRYPDPEELQQAIAAFNPLRHQYGPKGISVVGERPPTAKGMKDWKQEARMEGIEESALTKSPTDYPAYLKEELEIQRGIIPTRAQPKARKKKEAVEPIETYMEGDVPVNVYPTQKATGGQITPQEMMHAMIAQGQQPQRFKKGGNAINKAFMGLGAADIGSSLVGKNYGEALGKTYDYGLGMMPLKASLPALLATFSPELGPREGSRDWDIENQAANARIQKQLQAQALRDRAYRERLEALQEQDLLGQYETKNYPEFK